LVGGTPLTETRGGGRCHLVREEERDAGLSLYMRCVAEGAPGLCITRLRPPVPGGDAPRQTAVRLSSLPGKGSLRPDQLGLMQKTIFDFIDENPTAAVFLEGLDYILAEKGREELVRFLYALGDKAMDFDATVIVSLHGAGLGSGEAAAFGRALASVPI
jgi:hypothetical protein